MFRQVRFTAMDAVVVFVPQGEEPPAVVKEAIDEVDAARWYPVSGGFNVKFPLPDGIDRTIFSIEAGGWNHIHCELCNRDIRDSTSYWRSETAKVACICEPCYAELQKQERKK
jgi:hypothetical protein